MALRIVHTSDWHLGRALHGEPLLEDQAHALEQLFRALADARPDALVLAGDVYDRAVPPKEAVELLDGFLTRLALDLKIPAVIIAGNHDGPERLAFASRLLESRAIFVRGAQERVAEPVRVGEGAIFAVPFVDPELVRAAEGPDGDDALRDYGAATAAVLARARAVAAREAGPTVAVAHAFVGGATTSESERAIPVGGTGAVPASVFDGFDYVALGHLHRPQDCGAPRVRYSGSLLKYSSSEADHPKGFSLVEVEKGTVRGTFVPLPPRRDAVVLRGTLQELLERPEFERHAGDLVWAVLTDTAYQVDVKARLEKRFRHVLEVTREKLALPEGASPFADRVRAAGQDERKLFESFFEYAEGASPGPELRAAFEEALRKARAGEEAA